MTDLTDRSLDRSVTPSPNRDGHPTQNSSVTRSHGRTDGRTDGEDNHLTIKISPNASPAGGLEESTESETNGCQYDDNCDRPAAYIVTYDDDFIPPPRPPQIGWLACVECTAVIRANDPLGYVDTIRSIPREAAS